MITQKGNIVFTFDDILVNSTYYLYEYLESNYKVYGKYLNIYNLYNKQYIYNRDNKDLILYLFNQKLYNNKYINNMFNNLYLNLLNNYYSKDMYRYMEPTKLAKSTLANPLFIDNQGIENVYVIIKYKINEEKISKENFINKYFKNLKIKIIFINETEHEYIDAFNSIKKWNLVVTDDTELIKLLAATNIDHKEFLLLKCGYGKIPEELKYLIREKNGNITVYEN